MIGVLASEVIVVPPTDDFRSEKVLLVMENVEGGPIVLGFGQQPTSSRVCEAIARTFFRDIVRVRCPWAPGFCLHGCKTPS
jgi:hypothetical protein